jgi:hypothetical protein
MGMSEIEGAAAEVIRALRSSTTRTITEAQREVLGFLIALQWARSRFLLTTLRRTTLGPDVPVDDTNRPVVNEAVASRKRRGLGVAGAG